MDYLSGLKRFGMRLGLDNIFELLKRLGNPHKRVKTVLVAGTNGKGSTSAILASILTAGGYKTGLYTSPHLFRFNERIKIDGREIQDEDMELILERVKSVSEDMEITYFEAATALAFVCFAAEEVDMAILEVGMGGRFDATNVADPLVSIITPIGMDHTGHLGKTLGKIALEKAGIIRPNRHVVVAPQASSARQSILAMASEKGAIPYVEEADWVVNTAAYPSFSYRGKQLRVEDVRCSLTGRHQIYNAATAIAAADLLYEHGFDLSPDNIKDGVANVSWPGRLEIIPAGPLTVFDSAHNQAAAKVLKASLKEDFSYDKLHLIIGMGRMKDFRGFIKSLSPLAERVYAVPVEECPCHDPEKLALEASKYVKKTKAFPSMKAALDTALGEASQDDLVLIAGSLYMRGEVEKTLG